MYAAKDRSEYKCFPPQKKGRAKPASAKLRFSMLGHRQRGGDWAAGGLSAGGLPAGGR